MVEKVEQKDKLTDEDLRFAHNLLQKNALGHGTGIYNAFSLSMAGLLVLLGGVIASANRTSIPELPICIGVSIVGFLICRFMWLQRKASINCINKMGKIEKRLGIDVILPRDYRKPPITCKGFTKADWTLVTALVVLVILIIFTLYTI